MTEARADRDEILAQVRRILCESLMLTEAEVKPESLFVQDLDIDSLGFAELEFSLEESFGIKFPDVKLSPEMFALSLPESLVAIETMPGGTTLFEFMKAEVVRSVCARGGHETAATAATAGRERAGAASEEGDAGEDVFRAATVGDLARAVGGPVPSGLAAEAPLESLHIAELFRFVTASVMARYVEHLVARRGS